MLYTYWLEGKLKLLSKYVKKTFRSPQKAVSPLSATKLYTVVEPLSPE
jgi:hypothetical protein